MEAFHSFWTKPGRVINWGEIRFPDYELLTMMLSALKWRKQNGTIRMITDSAGAEFFTDLGLAGLWDDLGTELDGVPEDLDPYLFWAAGKLYALRRMPCPCVMLDTDLIIWKGLDIPRELDLVAAHGEDLYPDVYPDPGVFVLKDGYHFPAGWDFSLPAANTAFLYLRNPSFRDYYTDSAIAFMRGVKGDGLDSTVAMCFAEQRILPMCAKVLDQNMGCLLDLAAAEKQDFVTHVWGHKRAMEQDERLRTAFCVRCARRLLRDFPEWEDTLARCERLRRYFFPSRFG